jgi:hypothetical protein
VNECQLSGTADAFGATEPSAQLKRRKDVSVEPAGELLDWAPACEDLDRRTRDASCELRDPLVLGRGSDAVQLQGFGGFDGERECRRAVNGRGAGVGQRSAVKDETRIFVHGVILLFQGRTEAWGPEVNQRWGATRS